MEQIISWLAQYGLAAVFVNVGLLQLGLPLPAYPMLVLTGALSVTGQYSPIGLLATAVLACLVSDSVWYVMGQRYGARVLRTLCRISLSPGECVRQTESIFTRWGVRSLIVAKFLPGFASLATALAGRARVPYGRFLLFDAIGATLYAGVGIGLGVMFHDTVYQVLSVLADMGRIGGCVLLAGFAVFLARKWWQRQRFHRQLRMARISPRELQALSDAGTPAVLLDVRSPAKRGEGGIIPGAVIWSDLNRSAASLDLPHDTQVVVYCACPDDASAALVAKRLIKAGFTHVRPLHGGIDAWQAEGFSLDFPKPA